MLLSIKKILAVLTVITMLGIPMNVLATDQININTATATQLQSVKGVGEKTADKIIAYREQHGQFTNVNELCKVQGIGEKSIQKMSGQLCIK
jgi:competence protein ComEA